MGHLWTFVCMQKILGTSAWALVRAGLRECAPQHAHRTGRLCVCAPPAPPSRAPQRSLLALRRARREVVARAAQRGEVVAWSVLLRERQRGAVLGLEAPRRLPQRLP